MVGMYSLVGMSICIKRGSKARPPGYLIICPVHIHLYFLLQCGSIWNMQKGMGEECFNTSKFLKKIKHQRIDIFKCFLVALSLSDRRGNHTDTLVHTIRWELARASATPRVSLSMELLIAIAPWRIPTAPRSIKENFLHKYAPKSQSINLQIVFKV